MHSGRRRSTDLEWHVFNAKMNLIIEDAKSATRKANLKWKVILHILCAYNIGNIETITRSTPDQDYDHTFLNEEARSAHHIIDYQPTLVITKCASKGSKAILYKSMSADQLDHSSWNIFLCNPKHAFAVVSQYRWWWGASLIEGTMVQSLQPPVASDAWPLHVGARWSVGFEPVI